MIAWLKSQWSHKIVENDYSASDLDVSHLRFHWRNFCKCNKDL